MDKALEIGSDRGIVKHYDGGEVCVNCKDTGNTCVNYQEGIDKRMMLDHDGNPQVCDGRIEGCEIMLAAIDAYAFPVDQIVRNHQQA